MCFAEHPILVCVTFPALAFSDPLNRFKDVLASRVNEGNPARLIKVGLKQLIIME